VQIAEDPALPPEPLSRRTVAFVNLAHALDHFVLLIFPTAVLAIAAERGLSYAELIGLSTGAFVAFGFFSLPAGWLADRLGRRNLLALFFLGCGGACLGLAIAATPIAQPMPPSRETLRETAVKAVALLLASGFAAAAEPTTRVRGVIERVDGNVLTIATREGPSVRLTLTPDATITALVPADLAAASKGSFIGTAAVPQPDGRLKAQEVLIFPEAMHGVGEGHRAWDLTPDSTMTNATVEAVVSDVAGRVLTLAYQDGRQQLVVPPGTPVVTLAPGDASLLQPGNHVFLGATRQPGGGGLTASRLTVGKDGLVPPM
jgi:MFS family permease